MALFDLVRVRVVSTGTGGPLQLGQPDGGGRGFAAAGVPDGATVSYGLAQGALRETGTGTYNAAAQTVTRGFGASTTGSPIALDGTAVLQITPLAADFAGPAGPVVHTQASPADEWTFNHNLGFRPLVEVLSPGGIEVGAQVAHITVNQVKIYFSSPQTGQALAR